MFVIVKFFFADTTAMNDKQVKDSYFIQLFSALFVLLYLPRLGTCLLYKAFGKILTRDLSIILPSREIGPR